VILDFEGGVHALSRMLGGMTKDITAKLGDRGGPGNMRTCSALPSPSTSTKKPEILKREETSPLILIII